MAEKTVKKTVKIIEEKEVKAPVKKTKKCEPKVVTKRKILFVASEARPFIATGGLASTIVRHCKHNITLDDDLLLKGLNILYNKNK